MIEVQGNIFDLAFQCNVPSILLVTTNGVWNERTRKAVLGAGFARSVKDRFPQISENLGLFLRINYHRLRQISEEEEELWNIPYKLHTHKETHIFSFPTKPTRVLMTKDTVLPRYFVQTKVGEYIEGWKGFSPLSLIERSAKYISTLIGEKPSLIEKVFSIRPGCSNGGLSWETQVKPLLDKYMDDRFIVVERGGKYEVPHNP